MLVRYLSELEDLKKNSLLGGFFPSLNLKRWKKTAYGKILQHYSEKRRKWFNNY